MYKVNLDKEREMRLNHKALYEIDRELRGTWGKPLFAALSDPLNSLSIELLVIILSNALEGRPSKDAVLEMMDAEGFNFTDCVKTVVEAITDAYGVDETEVKDSEEGNLTGQ